MSDPMEELTPRRIVAELDRYVVGQQRAKRAVAIALRNRWRRQRVPEGLREEILPKNILMIGPTGVGKTEIARRLARLAGCPFLKVEATKFTEVGYVGRDVESIVRDLVHLAVNEVRLEQMQEVRGLAEELAEERLLDLLLPGSRGSASTRQRLRQRLRQGLLDDREVVLETPQRAVPMVEVLSAAGLEELEMNLREMLSGLAQQGTRRRRLTVREAREVLVQEECQGLIDMDRVAEVARRRVEQSGIVFLDEIDKVVSKGPGGAGPDVSREGVQRDLLPLVEGTTVNTRYGPVRTDHILFIAAGSFQGCRPSDLIPELQGRFPIRVELDPLGEEDFVRILTEPENALLRQYQELMRTEGVELTFREDAVREIAHIAQQINARTENIGARRLYTVVERLLEEISFEAPERRGQRVVIDAPYVRRALQEVLEQEDLSRYVL